MKNTKFVINWAFFIMSSEMVSDGLSWSWFVSVGLKWSQMVSDGFGWSRMVSDGLSWSVRMEKWDL